MTHIATENQDLKVLIELADQMCERMDAYVKNSNEYCDTVMYDIEQCMWDIHRSSRDLKEIYAYFG